MDKRIEAIAYSLWVDSLNKSRFPRNANNSVMNCWELYDYWDKLDQKTKQTYLKHAEGRS